MRARRQRAVQQRGERTRIEELLKREIEAKKRVELMLRSYKDEVETLNEALKIAALDIAEAAGSDLDDDDSADGDEFDDAENAEPPAPTQSARPDAKPRTIFVNPDGSFTNK